MLKFSPANSKTKALYQVEGIAPYLEGRRKVYSLDLPSGLSCPSARECKSMAVPRTDDPTRFIIKDGPQCRFRCFSASQEIVYPATRKARRHNFDVMRKMRGATQCLSMLEASLPSNLGVLRFHVGGDFFKPAYFDAAIRLADARPDVLFYAYTKELKNFLKHPIPPMGNIRPNFIVTASRGGKHDHLIHDLSLREAVVMFSEAEAEEKGLPIDHDDSHAATPGGSFALLLHGVQPAQSNASRALSALKGKGSYASK